jgi:hypothetical protein
MMIALQILLPVLLCVAVIAVVQLCKKTAKPKPMLVWRIPPHVVPVSADKYIKFHEENEGEEPKDRWLRREARKRQFKMNMEFLDEECLNAILFLSALLFEQDQIHKNKSGFKYKPHEVIIEELVHQATETRWKQVRCRVIANLRFWLGLRVDMRAFNEMFAAYKSLEYQFLLLVQTQDTRLHRMLLERLGLGWLEIVDPDDPEDDPEGEAIAG